MSESTKRLYCPSCGEEVDTFMMVAPEGEAYHCFICGVKLSGEKAGQIRPLDLMLLAEDSMVFREVMQDKILELGLAREVQVAENGEEVIALYTQNLVGERSISLAVLDIRMPGMNGINAAMAIRAVEKGAQVKRRVPILFFSSMKCDDTLREIFKHCAPARYINKGNTDSPDELSDRLVEVIHKLLAESRGG